jgi:dihydroorotase
MTAASHRSTLPGPILLKGGRVVDPMYRRDGMFDVRIEDGQIVQVDKDLPLDGARVVDVPSGVVVCPGLIDIHVHLREPGQEHKETVATGVHAAVAGGFVGIACMPNTDPVNDHAGVTELILGRAAEAGLSRVYPIGAVSIGSKGEQLTEIGELYKAGCVGISDDGHPIADALLMRRALEYASMFDIPVINHCEDPSLKGDGSAHEGYHAAVLGLRGIPGAAESIMVERDVSLSELTGGHVHIAHMSARGSLRAVRSGKERGIGVTCEVTPHHFILTDEQLSYDTNFKMNPPLRDGADRDAMLEGLIDGSIDVIATDHAPHHADEKAVEFDSAPFGIVGLETAVPLVLDRLLHTGHLTLSRIIELLAVNPARVLGLKGGGLTVGAPADITLLAPDATVEVSAASFRSKGRNTPFDGWSLHGAVAATMILGRTVYASDAVAGLAALGDPVGS